MLLRLQVKDFSQMQGCGKIQNGDKKSEKKKITAKKSSERYTVRMM